LRTQNDINLSPSSNAVKDVRNKKHWHNKKEATSPNTEHQCSNKKLVAAFILKHDILSEENVVVLAEPKLKNGIPSTFKARTGTNMAHPHLPQQRSNKEA
jgi:hypothetical protein